MIVPNFVPEPVQIEGCVADAPWKAQITFLREVALIHGSCWLLGTILALSIPGNALSLEGAAMASALSIAILFAIRHKPLSAQIGLAIPGLASLAVLFRCLSVWSPVVAVATSVLYVLLARRDYSRIGHFTLCLAVSVPVVALICLAKHLPPQEAWRQMLILIAVLLYGVTDLTSITFRRQPEESLAASLDLFRDVYNGITWLVRTREHIRTHRIFRRKTS